MRELDQSILHFMVTFDYEASFDAAKCVAYIEKCATAVAFALKVRGGGGDITTCALKYCNSVSAHTEFVTVVSCMFSQAPVFLERMIRRWSVP